MLQMGNLWLSPDPRGLCIFNAPFRVAYLGHWRVSRWCYLSVFGSLPSDARNQFRWIKPKRIAQSCSRIRHPRLGGMRFLVTMQLAAEAARMPIRLSARSEHRLVMRLSYLACHLGP